MFSYLCIGTTFMELVILNRYFSILFRNTVPFTQKVLFRYVISGIMIYLSTVYFLPVEITGLLNFASTFLLASQYPSRVETQIIYSFIHLALGFTAEVISCFVITRLQIINSTALLTDQNTRLLVLVFTYLIMILFIQIIRLFKRDDDLKIHWSHYLAMISMVLISFFIINTLFFYCEKNWYYVLAVVGIVFINILVIFLFDRIIEKFRLYEEKKLLEKQIDYQQCNYQKSVDSFKSIKRILHDTNKQLLLIERYIQEDRGHDAICYIHDILGLMNTSYKRVQTGNLTIDALVTNALCIAHERNIDTKCDINLPAEHITVDRYDLCVILGNMLENALEAVSLLEPGSSRHLEILITIQNGSLFIQVMNSYQPPSARMRQPRKANPELHGIGLSNIRLTAEKYGGHFFTDAAGNLFTANVFLPL